MKSLSARTMIIVMVVSMLVLSGSFFAFPANRTQNTASSHVSALPSSLKGASFALITLHNNQPVATQSPFQQELTVNSSVYSSLEAANLSNVEFTYLSGQVIPSWLESGNSNTAYQSVYWLNVTGIPANGNLAIYMVFLPLNEMAFNGVNVGEAAQLSGPVGSASFGVYNDISAVMSPGLMYQFYIPEFGYATPTISAMASASLARGTVISGTSETSTVSPFTTALRGNTSNVNGDTLNNVIINYQAGYTGGLPLPNPPVSNTNQFVAKVAGWINAPNTYNFIGAVSDDGIIVGSTGTGGNASGINWVDAGNATNIISHWNAESATTYIGFAPGGTSRLQAGYFNSGGASYLAIYSSPNVTYYHAALAPNNVMPTAAFSSSVNNTLYSVTMTPSGLPLNVNWTLDIHGIQAFNVNAGTPVAVNLPNGTYSYTISSSSNKYRPLSNGGTIHIAGSEFTGTVKFVPVNYAVTFRESASSALPSGTLWYLNLSGAGFMSIPTAANNTTVMLQNGTYTATFAASHNSVNYRANIVTFTVSGAKQTILFTFVKAYAVTFNENGLPSGTQWFVNATGWGPFTTTGSSITMYAANGTLTYTVATTDKIYSSSGGSITVAGVPKTVNLKFSLVNYTVDMLWVPFVPQNTTWYVNATSGAFSIEANSTSSLAVFRLHNGTFNYTVQTDNGSIRGLPGSFTVAGSSVTVLVDFTLVFYNITFTESGLPSGTPWAATVNYALGLYNTSRAQSMLFQLPNGTFSYDVSTPDTAFNPQNSSANVTVTGTMTVNIAFVPYNYNVNFTETGLPSGTSWSLSDGSIHLSSTGSTIHTALHNGTYSFAVSSSNSAYEGFLSSITVVVDGANVSFTVVFTEKTSSVTFTVENLPSSVSSWTLNIKGGPSVQVQGQAVSLNLAYGSYSYTVSISGKGTVYTGSLNVGSTSMNVYINLTGSAAGSTISSSTTLYGSGYTAVQQPAGASWLMEVTQ